MGLTDLQMRVLDLIAEHGPLRPGGLSLLLWPDQRGRRLLLYKNAEIILEGLRRLALVEWTGTGMHCRLTSQDEAMS